MASLWACDKELSGSIRCGGIVLVAEGLLASEDGLSSVVLGSCH